jgi:hypothetical protein
LIYLLKKNYTDTDIAFLRETTLARIDCMIKEEDQFSDFVSYLKSSPPGSMHHKGRLALIGSVPNADVIKILRKSNVAMAGIVSTLVKSPPSYDDITLVHEIGGLRMRIKKNSLKSISGKYNDLWNGKITHGLRTTKNSKLQFLHSDGNDPKFIEVSIRASGTPLRYLLTNQQLLQLDKELVFRNQYTIQLVVALYECLYVYCRKVLGINDIVVISGSNSIGYHLDSLVRADRIKR